jgi:serine/threonine protein kinase
LAADSKGMLTNNFIEEKNSVVFEIAKTLKELHNGKIFHRDIKPTPTILRNMD